MPSPTVRAAYLVPADCEVQGAVLEAFASALRAVQAWYRERLESQTFRLDDRVRAARPVGRPTGRP